jgi:uncharacterized protein YcaQ
MSLTELSIFLPEPKRRWGHYVLPCRLRDGEATSEPAQTLGSHGARPPELSHRGLREVLQLTRRLTQATRRRETINRLFRSCALLVRQDTPRY